MSVGVKWVGGEVGGWSKWVAVHLRLMGSIHRFQIYKVFGCRGSRG